MADFLNGLSTFPVLRIEPDWKSPIKTELELSRAILTFIGTVEVITTFDDERPFLADLNFTQLDKVDEKNLTEFFIARKGRHEKFWLPAPYNYFTLAVDALSANSELIVKNNLFADAFRGHERLMVLLNNGDMLTFTISSVSAGPVPSQETITISPALDRSFSISDVQRMSFIHLGRFQADNITFSYQASFASEANQKFIELIKEYP